MPKILTPEQKIIKDRCVVDVDDFEWWLEQKGWSWQGLADGAYGISVAEAELLYVWEDPVLWCSTYLDEPDSPGSPYSFFDYQVPSIRAWHQESVHCDGAEVGKTREIIALTLWGMISGFGFSKRLPSMLIGAPQQTHLDEIIMAIEEVVGVADGLPGQKSILNQFWLKPKKHPHYMMRFLNTNPYTGKQGVGRVYFRPAGHDGVAFRGVHVSSMQLMDEAAKMQSELCWTEFFRAAKPGCIFKSYSVPDGRRDSLFYMQTQKAIPNLDPDKKGARLFNWSKELMPPPFWDKDRERDLAEKYGGKDSSGYTRNVLGLHGDPQDTVWPTSTLMPNVRNVLEYRALKLVCDENTGNLHVEGYRIELSTTKDNKKIGDKIYIAERSQDLDDFTDVHDRDAVRMCVRDLLREFFNPVEGVVELWGGCDLGIGDPTEIFVYDRKGLEMKHIARLHIKGAGYELLQEFIYCLDELFEWKIKSWGVDLGSAGVSVVGNMHSQDIYNEGEYYDRMQGFTFGEVTDAIDEDGNLIEKENRKKEMEAVRMPFKQLATELWTKRYQKHEAAIPYDAEVVQHYMNHTATSSKTTDRLIYDKKNDHTIDAKRCAMLAKVFYEGGAADVFSSGVHLRSAA